MVTPQARVGKICILDDDPSILRSLKELLSSDDFEAEVFDDRAEAGESAKKV